MANQELGIDVKSVVDDAIEGLQELIDKLTNIPESIDTTIGIDSGDATTEMDGIKTKADETAGSIEEIGTAASTSGSDVATGMSTASGSIDDVTGSAQNASGAVEDVGNKSTETGDKADAGFATAAIAIGGFLYGLDSALTQTTELNTQFDKMTNMPTSTTIPESTTRMDVADITNVGFNTQEALDYITLLKQMGVTSEDSLKRGADAFDALDEGTNASQEDVEKFARSMKVMHVDLNNIPSTFNAAAYANANMMGGFKEFTTWMQKYDSQFSEMGISVDQAAILIKAAQDKFGGGRAAYTGLGTAIKESGGDPEKLAASLGVSNDKLDHASDITSQYTGKVEANRQTMRDNAKDTDKMGAAIEDINTVFGDSIGKLENFGIAVGSAIGGLYIAGPAITKIMDSLWGTDYTPKYTEWVTRNFTTPLRGLSSKIADTVKGLNLEEVINKVLGIKPIRFNLNFGGGLDEFARMESTIGEITPKVESRIGSFVSNIRGRIDGLKDSNIFQKILGDEKGAVKLNFIDELIPKITSQLPRLESVGKAFPMAISRGLRLALVGAVGDIGVGALQLIDGLANYTSILKDPIGYFWPALAWIIPERLRQAFSPDNMLRMLGGEDLYNRFMDWATNSVMLPMQKAIADTFRDPMSLFKPITDGINWIINQIVNAGSSMYNAGKSFLGSLVQGIKDSMPDLTNILQWIADHFPRSPPKTGPLSEVTAASMVSFGNDLSSALQQGINTNAPIDPYAVKTPLGISLGDYQKNAGAIVSTATGGPGYTTSSIGEGQNLVRGTVANPGSTPSNPVWTKATESNVYNTPAPKMNPAYLNEHTDYTGPFIQNLANDFSSRMYAAGKSTIAAIESMNASYLKSAYGIGGWSGGWFSGHETGKGGGGYTVAGSAADIAMYGRGITSKELSDLNKGLGGIMPQYAYAATHGLSFGGGGGGSASIADSAAENARRQALWNSAKTTTKTTTEAQHITVNIPGDVSIRSDIDIKKLAQQIGSEINNQSLSNGFSSINAVR